LPPARRNGIATRCASSRNSSFHAKACMVLRIVVEAVQFDQFRAQGVWLVFVMRRPARARWHARAPSSPTVARWILRALPASYAFGSARDHPFNDGDKRMAFLVAVIFLGLDGWDFEASDEEVVKYTVTLAAGQLTEARLARWIRAGMKKR
jgi:hypothetical protein